MQSSVTSSVDISLDKAKIRVIKLLSAAREAFLQADLNKNSLSDKLKIVNDVAYIYTNVIDGKKYRVFGIRQDKQSKINFTEFREQVTNELELKGVKDSCQIIGDSEKFSEVGTKFSRKELMNLFEHNRDNIFYYGFTGNSGENGRLADTNHLVSEYLDDKAQGTSRAQRFVANVVDKHTTTAIKEWGCSISENISNFMMVYSNSKEPEVEFGSDAGLDALTTKRAVCLDGGIQSLLQVFNMLEHNVVINGLNKLRDGTNPKMVDPKSGKPYLSVCEFILYVKHEISNLGSEPTESDIKRFIKSYLQKHELFDTTKRDAGTKQALWNSAIELLFKKQLWKKFDLFSCKEAPPSAVIFLTDLGGDIDDAISIIDSVEVVKSTGTKILGVITSHIEPEEKARETKLILKYCGREDIPIYPGIGSARKNTKEHFRNLYPLFPTAYGFPNPDKGEKEWYPKQNTSYKESKIFGDEFRKMKLEMESSVDAIIRHAKIFSPVNKLVIIGLGPLHDLAAALDKDPSIAANIKLYAMGGLPPKGYNWNISPHITAKVISQVETICVTSDFIVNNKLEIEPDELQNIIARTHSHFGKAFLEGWQNWNKAKIGTIKTPLYDPTTSHLALQPENIKAMVSRKISFPCMINGMLKPEFKLGLIAYNQKDKQNEIAKFDDEKGVPVSFIDKIHDPIKLKRNILGSLTKQLTVMPDHSLPLSLTRNMTSLLSRSPYKRSFAIVAGLFAVGYVGANILKRIISKPKSTDMMITKSKL